MAATAALMRAGSALIAGALAWSLGAPGGIGPAHAGLSPSSPLAIRPAGTEADRPVGIPGQAARHQATAAASRLDDDLARLRSLEDTLESKDDDVARLRELRPDDRAREALYSGDDLARLREVRLHGIEDTLEGEDDRLERLREMHAAGGLTRGRPAHDDLSRLREVRERLQRREAWEGDLRRQAGELVRRIEALQQRSDALAAALGRQHQRIRTLERNLDHAVPRLLVRLRELRESRESTAQAVAGLAVLSRNVELDGTDKARLLAISPVILERLNAAEARAEALHKRLEAIVAEHERARTRVAATAADLERVGARRDHAQEVRARLLAQLSSMQVELATLRAERQVLARRVRASRHAYSARATPQPDRPALDRFARAPLTEAGFGRGAALAARTNSERHLAGNVDGMQRTAPRLVAAAPRPAPDIADLAMPAAPLGPMRSGPGDAILRGSLGPALPDAARRVAQLVNTTHPSVPPKPFPRVRIAHVELSRLEPAPMALLPVEVLARLGPEPGGLDGPGVAIPTARGQAVAAPQDGRIVFAGNFRSYGLLLIIAHEREYHTLLWGFSELAVQVGDTVRSGQVVGAMGSQSQASPRLHVELRRHGRPVNPLSWLAANTSKVRG